MDSLDRIYRRVARPWTADELADRYQAAYGRGASDLPVGEPPPERPITLLATAVPRLISLAVAANVLHVLPDTRSQAGAGVADGLMARSTRPPLAAFSAAISHSKPTADPAAMIPMSGCRSPSSRQPSGLSTLQPTSATPRAIEHAQQSGRFAALAIASLDRDTPSVPEAITDCIAHLLFACVFADKRRTHRLTHSGPASSAPRRASRLGQGQHGTRRPPPSARESPQR